MTELQRWIQYSNKITQVQGDCCSMIFLKVVRKCTLAKKNEEEEEEAAAFCRSVLAMTPSSLTNFRIQKSESFQYP